MTEPATDEELLIYREWDSHPLTYPRLAVRTVTAALFARIEADRAEISSVRKAALSKDRVIEQQAAEIARLKAEVERLTPTPSKPCCSDAMGMPKPCNHRTGRAR